MKQFIPPKVYSIPLSEVFADWEWHSRARGATNVFPQLKQSIKEIGQDNPVDVRPNPDPHGKRWLLTTGFMRYAALEQLQAETGVNTIRVMVFIETDEEARIRNIRSNCHP